MMNNVMHCTLFVICVVNYMNLSSAMRIGGQSPPPPAPLVLQMQEEDLGFIANGQDPCTGVSIWRPQRNHIAHIHCRHAAAAFNRLPVEQRDRCMYTARPRCRPMPLVKKCTVLRRRLMYHPCRLLGFKYETTELAWCVAHLGIPMPIINDPPPDPDQGDDEEDQEDEEDDPDAWMDQEAAEPVG